MQKKINEKTSELEVIIAAKKENWKNTQAEVKNDLIKNLSIKGFRKGKVPPQIAHKYIAQADVMRKAVEKIVRVIAKEAYESIDKDTIVLFAPSYLVNKISDAELELKFVYPIFPKFEIGNYKNLDIKFNQKKVEQKEISDEIEKMLSNQTILKDKKGAVEDGDVAIIDYEGFVDGKAFEGGKAEKHHLKIGSKQFIPGFEEQLIGLQANSEKEIEVTFPQNYNSEELKGKKAKFKIFIHDVKIEEKPELNDEFAKTSGVPNVKTLAELKSYIEKVFEKRNYQQAMIDFQKKAFEIIAKTSKGLIVAPALVQNEADNLKNNMKEDLKKQGLEYKNYVEAVGISEKELDSNFVKQAKTRLIDAFIFAEIAKQEKVIINENDYNNRYEELAKIYGQSVAEIKKMITKEQMQVPLTNERVVELLIKNASKINSTK